MKRSCRLWESATQTRRVPSIAIRWGYRLSATTALRSPSVLGGIMLRVTLVNEVRPQPYTVLGWQVKDATATARALAKAGVPPERYSHVPQDDDGIWTAPGGAKIAWFKDPDGNILSIAQM